MLSMASWPASLAVDSPYLYWADLYSGGHMTPPGLYRLALDTQTKCEISIYVSPTSGVGSNASGIFWIDQQGLMRTSSP
jgi:hypothetical protein